MVKAAPSFADEISSCVFTPYLIPGEYEEPFQLENFIGTGFTLPNRLLSSNVVSSLGYCFYADDFEGIKASGYKTRHFGANHETMALIPDFLAGLMVNEHYYFSYESGIANAKLLYLTSSNSNLYCWYLIVSPPGAADEDALVYVSQEFGSKQKAK